MNDLSEMNWRARQERVKLAAEIWLRSQPAGTVLGTTELAHAVANALGAAKAQFPTILRDLTKVAPGSPHARQNGALFQSYGRTARRWQWYQTTADAESAPAVPSVERANRLDETDVAEFQAWKAAGSPAAGDPADWRRHVARWLTVGLERGEVTDATAEATTLSLLDPTPNGDENADFNPNEEF